METITWQEFEKVELRVGTVVAVEDFPEARKPAWTLTVDFGEYGVKRSSAQITVHYRKEDLIGRQVIGVPMRGQDVVGFYSVGTYGRQGIT